MIFHFPSSRTCTSNILIVWKCKCSKTTFLFSVGDSEIFFVLAVQSSNFLPEVFQKSSFTLNGEVYVSLPLTPCSPPQTSQKKWKPFIPRWEMTIQRKEGRGRRGLRTVKQSFFRTTLTMIVCSWIHLIKVVLVWGGDTDGWSFTIKSCVCYSTKSDYKHFIYFLWLLTELNI